MPWPRFTPRGTKVLSPETSDMLSELSDCEGSQVKLGVTKLKNNMIPLKDKLLVKKYNIMFNIYVECGFSKLKDLVSGFFSKINWTDGENKLRNHQLINKWCNCKDNIEFSACVYPSKLSYDYIGSGLLIKLKHTRKQLQNNDIKKSDIPLEIRKRLHSFPNMIIIDNHIWWNDIGSEIAYNLSCFLTDKKIRCFILSIWDDLYFIKKDFKYNAEKRWIALGNNIDNISNEMIPGKNAKIKLKACLNNNWKNLDNKSKKFLITAVALYDKFEIVRNFLLDASIISISLAKSIESTLAFRIFIPFRKWFMSHPKWSKDSLSDDIKNYKIKNIAYFVREELSHPPEIGKIAFFLKNIVDAKAKIKCLSIYKAFFEFVNNFNNPDYILLENKLCRHLIYINVNFRNGAAHASLQNFSTAEKFLEYVIGTNTKTGFIDNLIDATETIR